jgi:hypothetical protein
MKRNAWNIPRIIPEKLLFGPDGGDRFDQASREKIGESPDHLVHFGVQEREVIVIGLQFAAYPFSGLLEFVSFFEFTVNDHALTSPRQASCDVKALEGIEG